MIHIESQAMAEVLFWYFVVIVIFAVGAGLICHIYDCMEETPEEQAARKAERIAKQATKEYKKRKRMRSGFWNIFN